MKTIPKDCTIVIPAITNEDIISKLFAGIENIDNKVFFVIEDKRIPHKEIIGWSTRSKTVVLVNSESFRTKDVLCLGYHCQINKTDLKFVSI